MLYMGWLSNDRKSRATDRLIKLMIHHVLFQDFDMH